MTTIFLEGCIDQCTYQIDGAVGQSPSPLLFRISSDSQVVWFDANAAQFRDLASKLVQAADFIENK